MFKIAVSFLYQVPGNKNPPQTWSVRELSYISKKHFILLPRILGWIRQASWLVVSDVLDAKILEYLEQGLAYVRESYCTVVWIALLNQDVAIEAAHLVDGEDTDTTE